MSTEVEPAEAATAVSTALYHLEEACDKNIVIGKLKLAMDCLGLTVVQIEPIVSITYAYQQLNCHGSTAGQSLPLLCAILGEMNVHVEQLSGLKKFTTDEAIRECQKRTDFGFAKMIIKLCNDFSRDDFEKFRSLCLSKLANPVHSSQCPTDVELFQKLIRARKVVWPGSVQVLSEILTNMHKESSLVHVDEYKHLIGIIGSPTDTDQGQSLGRSVESSIAEDSGRFGTAVSTTEQQGVDPSSMVVVPGVLQPSPIQSDIRRVFIATGNPQGQPPAVVSNSRGTDDDETDGPKDSTTSPSVKPFNDQPGDHPPTLERHPSAPYVPRISNATPIQDSGNDDAILWIVKMALKVKSELYLKNLRMCLSPFWINLFVESMLVK